MDASLQSIAVSRNNESRDDRVDHHEWIFCPICGSKTRVKIRCDTVLENFPLFCPKCKQETNIQVKQRKLTVIKEPDAQTQSR